jgi:hypothetical protein
MHAVHISWFERPQGSPIEYENAQKRILEVFGQWKAPANFKIEFFVIRVGEWGGPFPGRPSISDEHTSQTIGIYLAMPGGKNGRSRPDTLTGSHGDKEYGGKLGLQYFGVWRLGWMVL